MQLAEGFVVELLPAQRDTLVSCKRTALTPRLVGGHDAIIIACEREHAADLIQRLPFAAAWRRLYKAAEARGPVTTLSTRMTESGAAMTIVFAKGGASAFERLTLAARAWKELDAPPRARVLFGALGMDATQAAALLETLVAAALAATAPMPSMKAKPLKSATPASITLLHDGAAPDVARSVAVDRGNHLARWLTTLPPNVLNSATYRRALRDLARRRRWRFSFLSEATLRRRGAGAFLAVARANEHRDAGIVRLQYRTAQRRRPPPRLALVGKGICFDTGGINLKTHKSMYHMHEDMQGSAVAVGTMLALSALEAPYDIDCWLAITENQIGARAFRPQEVVRASNGVTIQVAHSDAEGRMVLADTLALAARTTPDIIIDSQRSRDHASLRSAIGTAAPSPIDQNGAPRSSWPVATAASACGRFRWTKTTTSNSTQRSRTYCNARLTARPITSSPRAF